MARGLRIRDAFMEIKYSEKQIKIAVAALNNHQEKPYISHQWGELVFRLSQDDDPELSKKMCREMEALDKDPGFKVFRTSSECAPVMSKAMIP